MIKQPITSYITLPFKYKIKGRKIIIIIIKIFINERKTYLMYTYIER